jgi:hypothetical protein
MDEHILNDIRILKLNILGCDNDRAEFLTYWNFNNF